MSGQPLGPSLDLHISVLGDTPWPPQAGPHEGGPPLALPRGAYATRRPNQGVDTATHWLVLTEAKFEGSLRGYSHFVFLNCGTRGPYIDAACVPPEARGRPPPPGVPPPWLQPFVRRLNAKTALAGPLVS